MLNTMCAPCNANHQCPDYKKTTSMTENLNNFSIEDILKWRNSASKRVSGIDMIIKTESELITEKIKSINKAKKARMNDIKWIKHLNRHLVKRVFKNKD